MSAKNISMDDLVSLLLSKIGSGRILVGIAGPPGAGKSTFCNQVSELLNGKRKGSCAVFPMDGFHFDDVYLNEKGWQHRKGAPYTFDVGGFIHALGRLKANDEAFVAVPVFDRKLEIARAGARLIPQNVQIILVEGNYLLLDVPPWNAVASYFDISVMLRAEFDVLEKRLGERWVKHAMTPDAVGQKLEENDLPNVRLVLNQSLEADYEIWTDC